MDPRKFRREWSEKHKQLRSLLESGEELESARELFYDLHGVLHSGSIAGWGAWSYADQIFKGLDESQFRRITPGVDHSLVWILWHISRVEDITMNILVAQGQQVYEKEDWADRIASPLHHTGNEIGSADLHQLSQLTNISQLFAYREAVGRQTRQIMGNISVERLKEKVSPSDIQRLIAKEAVLPQASGVLSYWGKRRIYQLFLMPPTRHVLVHLNEANRLREKSTSLNC